MVGFERNASFVTRKFPWLVVVDCQVNEFMGFFMCVKNARSERRPYKTWLSEVKNHSVHKVIHNLCG